MFGKKKRAAQAVDRETLEPVIRCSICTGEQVAGFRERESGVFQEIMLIRNAQDLAAFCRTYGVQEPIEKIY